MMELDAELLAEAIALESIIVERVLVEKCVHQFSVVSLKLRQSTEAV